MPGPVVRASVEIWNDTGGALVLLLPDRFSGGEISRSGDEIRVGASSGGGPTRLLGIRPVVGTRPTSASVGFISPVVQVLRVGSGHAAAVSVDLQSADGRVEACVARDLEALLWPNGAKWLGLVSVGDTNVDGVIDLDSGSVLVEEVVTDPEFHAILLARGIRCHTFLMERPTVP
jgi:hypothetical protein